MLIHLGHPLPKDVFIEAFWRGHDVDSAYNSFRVAIHGLRQSLATLWGNARAPGYVVSQRGNYFIDVTLPLWTDVGEFEARWSAGQELEKMGRQDEAIAEFTKAARLYGGDFLEEDRYEDWALIRREELMDIYLSMLGKISEHHFGTGDFETCVEFGRKILTKDSCREDAYQRVIVCYLSLGQRSRALRWYQLCKQTLRRELNCGVSQDTEALYDLLVGG